MVNQDPQPEIYQTSHEFDYTGALIAINTMRSVDIFTYQANNEEFRLYAMKVEIDCMFNIASALDTTVGGLTGSGLPTVGAGLVNDVYTGVEASSTSGDGIGALFSITVALTEATIADAKYSPDNANAASFGGMDFNIGVRVGGQLIPSTTFDASTIFCKSSKTMAFTTPVIVLFKQPFQIEVSNATALAALASYGKRRVRITLIGELGIQKQY
jgi:hypothetical protein